MKRKVTMSFTSPEKEKYFFYTHKVIVKQKYKNALYITTNTHTHNHNFKTVKVYSGRHLLRREGAARKISVVLGVRRSCGRCSIGGRRFHVCELS